MAKLTNKPAGKTGGKAKAAPQSVTSDQLVALQARVAALEGVLRAFGREIGRLPGTGILIDAEAGGSDGGADGGDAGGSDGGAEGGDAGGSDGGGDGGGGDARRPKRAKARR